MIPAYALLLLSPMGVIMWALVTHLKGEDKELRQNFGKWKQANKKAPRELPIAMPTVEKHSAWN